MRVRVVLAVLLVAALVTETEAGWFRRAWNFTKRVAGRVLRTARDRCSVAIDGSGVRGECRFKRALDGLSLSLNQDGKALRNDILQHDSQLCDLVKLANVPFDGFPKDLVEEFYTLADVDQNRELSKEEFSLFTKSMALYDLCIPDPAEMGSAPAPTPPPAA